MAAAVITPDPHPMPLADEREPGLGRMSKVLESQRNAPGNLPDEPADNPVRDDMPSRITGGDSHEGTR